MAAMKCTASMAWGLIWRSCMSVSNTGTLIVRSVSADPTECPTGDHSGDEVQRLCPLSHCFELLALRHDVCVSTLDALVIAVRAEEHRTLSPALPSVSVPNACLIACQVPMMVKERGNRKWTGGQACCGTPTLTASFNSEAVFAFPFGADGVAAFAGDAAAGAALGGAALAGAGVGEPPSPQTPFAAFWAACERAIVVQCNCSECGRGRGIDCLLGLTSHCSGDS